MRTKLFVGPAAAPQKGWWLRGAPADTAAGAQFFLQPITTSPAAAELFSTQEAAVGAAREVADTLVAAGGTVSLYISGRTGRILEERTYPRAADPPETKG